MKTTILTTVLSLLLVGTANSQPEGAFNPRSQVPYPFGYRAPYQNGYNGFGTYYGPSNQGSNLPMFAPRGYPSRMYPTYQRYFNPNLYRVYPRVYSPYFVYPY